MVVLAWTFGRKIVHCRINSGYTRTYNGTSPVILRSTRHHGPLVPSYLLLESEVICLLRTMNVIFSAIYVLSSSSVAILLRPFILIAY